MYQRRARQVKSDRQGGGKAPGFLIFDPPPPAVKLFGRVGVFITPPYPPPPPNSRRIFHIFPVADGSGPPSALCNVNVFEYLCPYTVNLLGL